MITESDVYWLTRMGAIKDSLSVVFAITFFVAFVFGAFSIVFAIISEERYDCNEDKSVERWRNAGLFLKRAFTACGIMLVIQVAQTLTPTTHEMAAIKVIPKIANNEDLQAVGRETVELAKDWLKELKPKKPAEKGQE